MGHPVTIALEICAIGVARLGITTSPAFFLRESVRSQHFQILNVLSLRSKSLEFSNLWLLRLGSCCSGLGARGASPFYVRHEKQKARQVLTGPQINIG